MLRSSVRYADTAQRFLLSLSLSTAWPAAYTEAVCLQGMRRLYEGLFFSDRSDCFSAIEPPDEARRRRPEGGIAVVLRLQLAVPVSDGSPPNAHCSLRAPSWSRGEWSESAGDGEKLVECRASLFFRRPIWSVESDCCGWLGTRPPWTGRLRIAVGLPPPVRTSSLARRRSFV